jgi:hypothetical protein
MEPIPPFREKLDLPTKVDYRLPSFPVARVKCEDSCSPISFTVPFHLPPPWSSSSSSSSSSGSPNNPASTAYQVPFHLPIPGSGSSSNNSMSTTHTTPVISNTALAHLQAGRFSSTASPLFGKVLKYPSPSTIVNCRVKGIMDEPLSEVVKEGNDDDVTVLSEGWDEVTNDGVVPDEHMRNEALIDPSNFSLTTICQGMVNDVSDGSLMESELQLIQNATVNTKQYERNKKGIEERFFDTVYTFGGPLLQPLTLFCLDGFKKERLFYVKLRGDKSEDKWFILNKCLVKVALKWRNNKKGKDFGKPYQPSTWETKLKYLFAIFRRKMIQFNQLTDFNGDGEFHSVLTAQWALEMEKDEKFASGIGTSTFDDDADKKLRDLFSAGKFNPFSTDTTTEAYEDRKRYMVYVLGRYFLR